MTGDRGDSLGIVLLIVLAFFAAVYAVLEAVA